MPKKIPEAVSVKNWVTTVTTEQQVKIINFLLWAYGSLLMATMLIFFCRVLNCGDFLWIFPS
jgi:hypothetical protein